VKGSVSSGGLEVDQPSGLTKEGWLLGRNHCPHKIPSLPGIIWPVGQRTQCVCVEKGKRTTWKAT
jgi:hypothetical protein